MKIMITCRAIDNMAGGVERQAIGLANEMIARGHDVSLFTLDNAEATSFYDMSDEVNWLKLNIGDPKQKASLKRRLQRMIKTRKLIREFSPDVILAFQQGMFLSMRIYSIGINIPVVAAERESPYRYDFIKSGKWKNLIFQTFRLAESILVQCESYVKSYPRYLQSKIVVIPNAIKPTHSDQQSTEREKIILCVGRLSFAKNQSVLIQSFCNLIEKHKGWKLIFAGEGEDRQKLEQEVSKLDLERSVTFLGAVKDTASLYNKSYLLCIPSKWEGFPNVLGEALAHGLPSVGYKGCGGVRDLIIDGENGLLADGNGDVKSLTQRLDALMSNPSIQKDMSRRAPFSVSKYKPEKIYDIWENFLQTASYNKGRK